MKKSLIFNLNWLLLLGMVLIQTPRVAEANPSLLGRKSKLLTCEIMLNSDFKDHSIKMSPLPSLREAKYRLQREIGDRSNEGISFSNVSYSGPLSKISPTKANEVIARLNGLEEHLTSSNLDQQILYYEIRGADIEKALNYLEVKEQELEPLYQKVYRQVWSSKARLFAQVMGVAMVASFTELSYDTLKHFSDVTVEGFKHGLFPLIVAADMVKNFWKPAIDYNREKYDLDFNRLKEFFKNPGKGKDDFFVSGSTISVPAEFHRFLMSKDQEGADYARQVATTQIGGTYLDKAFGNLFYHKERYNELLSRYVSNAGNMNRQLYLDHLAYYDEDAGEYVWMFFYRAYQNRPSGRKPKKVEQKETQKEIQWLPGLAPVPAGN